MARAATRLETLERRRNQLKSELSGLQDLHTGGSYVRGKIAEVAVRADHVIGRVLELDGTVAELLEDLGVEFDVVVTAERAGYYKPHPKPYQLALHELNLPPEGALFVAGSAFDLVGTAAVKLDTYWHNRVGLERPGEAPPPLREARTLKELFAEF